MKGAGNKKIKDVAKKILEMAQEDQRLRARIDHHGRDRHIWKKILVGDSKHTSVLKKIIQEHGWPSISMFGNQASHSAWLLVQHSPDQLFQERCLRLLRMAVRRNDGLPSDLAFLTDRVRVRKGKPQLFGTQYRLIEGAGSVPFPIWKKKDLSKRRRNYGLE